MKKSVMALVLGLMMIAPSVQAQRADRPNRQGQHQQTPRHQSAEDRREEAIVSGIIGGVIGLIAAEALDRDDDRYGRGRGDGYGRGGYNDRYERYPRYPQPQPRGVVFCFAESRRGEIFRARGQSARVAQAKAMDKCYMSARMCRPVGCQY